MKGEYIVVQWPESQMLMDWPGFEDHCYLVNDSRGLDEFGSSAYFVEVDWYNFNCGKSDS